MMTVETVFRNFCQVQIVELFDSKTNTVSFTGLVRDIPQALYDRVVYGIYTNENEDIIYMSLE